MGHMGKHSLGLQNTHAGNSEHIYHFSRFFVPFRKMQVIASVTEDVSSQASVNKHGNNIFFLRLRSKLYRAVDNINASRFEMVRLIFY